jgi:hypothetical protein
VGHTIVRHFAPSSVAFLSFVPRCSLTFLFDVSCFLLYSIYDDNDCQNSIQFSSYLDGFCYSSSAFDVGGRDVSSLSSFRYDYPSLSHYFSDTCQKMGISEDVSECMLLEDGTSTDSVLLEP